MFFIDTEQDERTAVKTAVALAVSRYRDTIGKFVQGQSSRLSIVEDKIIRIAAECAEVAKADSDEVTAKFRAFLADEVAVTKPEQQAVTDSYDEYQNSNEVPQPEHGVRDDVKDTDPVLDDDADATVDLAGESTVDSNSYISKTAAPNATNCPYCGHMMVAVQNAQNPAMAGAQQQCPNCGATVQATPGQQMAQPTGQPGFQQGMQTGVGGGMYAKCSRCEKNDAEEDSIFCESCNHFVVTGEEGEKDNSCGCGCKRCTDGDHCNGSDCHSGEDSDPKGTYSKEAQGQLEDPDLPDEPNVQSPVEEDATQQNLPPAVKEDTNGPAEVYTGVVQQTANADAAMAWSTPGDQDIRDVAAQYGLAPEEVQASLRIVADFGDALAVNGDPNADPNVEGYTELPEFGGRIPSQEQEVDVDNAIQHTADRTNLTEEDVYALVKESYGDDLGGQHYVSVTGEAHYYLPQELVPQPEQQPDVDPMSETPQEAVQSSVPSHLQSIAAFLEWEKALA